MSPWRCLAVLLALTPLAAAPLELVLNGRSRYAVYLPASAPATVKSGAADLVAYLKRISGAELPLVDQPREPMIALGDSPAAAAAGITCGDLPLEGYRLVTRGLNLYILGPDTADGAQTPQGGTSAGTRNGIYAFLEQLGVRFLMPGPQGDFVPRQLHLTVPEMDRRDAPFFLNRRVPYTQQGRSDVQQWWARQRLGHSLALHHGHNWTAIPTEAYKEHPEWFAMRGGVRVPPVGRYKLCVTQPGLHEAFAQAAIRFFDANPSATCFSLSPADSAGWCECEPCRALYEQDPNGDLSITPAILTFYNEIAKKVAVKYPEKVLAGYVYAAYVFPPSKPIKLSPNVFLVWAPSFDYGFTLFRPALRTQWEALLKQWTAVTDRISYYDLPVNISTEAGALNPPGLSILKFLYPRLKAAAVKGVYVYGIEAWGRAAPLNYLLARLAWDPETDVEATFDEYCAKAFAEGGDEINQLYRLLDAEVSRHYQEFPAAYYTLTADMMRDIYAKNFAEVERLYRAAEAKISDPDAKARLAMMGDNLTVLHWNLRQNGLLADAQKSSFYLADPAFYAFFKERTGSLALQPSRAAAGNVKVAPVVVAVGKPTNGEAVRPFLLRGNQRLLIYPTAATAEVRFNNITSRGKLLTCAVYGPTGELVTQTVIAPDQPIVLDPAGAGYYHLEVTAGSATFQVNVTGAAWAVAPPAGGEDKGLHLLNKATPLYFEVPAGTAEFDLSLIAEPPGETAVASLVDPTGREVAKFDVTAKSVDLQTIRVTTPGWWKIAVEKAPTGVLDDVWVELDSDLFGYFSIDPAAALSVRPQR
ncbi:MAG: DUF4838 domain-containing protein [Armatimonadetes bacterium]|nr:DUF4838 domain-containing protein [Armatimonadota bacterium]